MAVAIAFKLLPAMSASECVVRFSLRSFGVRVPPRLTAIRTAELFPLRAGNLRQRRAAIHAAAILRNQRFRAADLSLYTGEAMAPAKGLYAVL